MMKRISFGEERGRRIGGRKGACMRVWQARERESAHTRGREVQGERLRVQARKQMDTKKNTMRIMKRNKRNKHDKDGRTVNGLKL